ncbi:glycosyltransferase [Dyella japonica]|uniref:glycosyltransferase n=1 Tax=Dyella japonica TaxID=231455 RepID=UPI0002DB4259|nr:glycosyltransferase [Dyella japonica]
MIKYPEISILSKQISALIDRQMIEDDVWRMENAWYGSRVFPERPQGVCVYIGARSGLEVLLQLEYLPGSTIDVVELDARLHEALLVTVRNDSRVRVHASLEALFEALPEGSIVDHMRLEAHYLSMAEALVERYRIIALTTELHGTMQVSDGARRLRGRVEYLYLAHPLGGGRGFDKGAPEFDVSVIVPAYGVEKELAQCIESLAQQTAERLEIIVVDDGSPDRSGEIADDFARRYPGRVFVIHQKNGGCAAARSAGLAAARGEYVGFVDGDDWVDLNMYRHLHDIAINHGAEIAQCGFQLHYSTGEVESGNDIYAGSGPYGRQGVISNAVSILTVQPTIWRRIYSRQFLSANRIDFPAHIKRFDDLPFQFEALSNVKSIVTTAEQYYYYRQGRVGQDIMAKDKRLYVHFEIFDYLKPRICDHAKMDVIFKLLEVELNSHNWSLGRIEPQYKEEYHKLAVDSLRRGYEMLGPKRIRRIAKGLGPVPLALVEASLKP